MKKFLTLALLIVPFLCSLESASAQERFCKVASKKKPFALRFPNFAAKIGANHGYDEVVGTIEWSRNSYTQMGVDDCGRTIQWRATDITYRYILCNGAYGKCFTQTRRDGPIEYVVPVQTPCHQQPDLILPSAKGGVVSSAKGGVVSSGKSAPVNFSAPVSYK